MINKKILCKLIIIIKFILHKVIYINVYNSVEKMNIKKVEKWLI